MGEKPRDKYETAHIQAIAIEFSRRREGTPSASRTCVKLFDHKRARQIRRKGVVRIQSALCEVEVVV